MSPTINPYEEMVRIDGMMVGNVSTRGLHPLGRHKSLSERRCCGLKINLGQTEPVEPALMLDRNGGDHEVSWHRCARGGNGLVSARRPRRDRGSGQDTDYAGAPDRTDRRNRRGSGTAGGTRDWNDG